MPDKVDKGDGEDQRHARVFECRKGDTYIFVRVVKFSYSKKLGTWEIE